MVQIYVRSPPSCLPIHALRMSSPAAMSSLPLRGGCEDGFILVSEAAGRSLHVTPFRLKPLKRSTLASWKVRVQIRHILKTKLLNA